MPVTILVESHVRAADAEELRDDLGPLVAASRKGGGCLRYDFYVDVEDGTRFLFLQEWQSEADYRRHFQSDYAQAMLTKWENRWRFSPTVLTLEDLPPPPSRGG